MRRFDRLPPFTRKAAQPLYKTGLEIGNFEMKNMLAFQKLIVFTLVVVLLTFVVQGMGYAQGRGKIYWTESGKIRRANLNGSAVEDIITELEQPRDITLDHATVRCTTGLNPTHQKYGVLTLMDPISKTLLLDSSL